MPQQPREACVLAPPEPLDATVARQARKEARQELRRPSMPPPPQERQRDDAE